MYCIDFEYDNQKLSDYGCIVCQILEDSGTKAVNIGSQITFNTIYNPSTNKFRRSSAQYDTAYVTTIEVCKNPCGNSDTFTPEEVAHMTRWLNKEVYRKFKMIYQDGELTEMYYNASMNVQPIKFGDKIIGLQLAMQTDAPFAYYDEVEYTMAFTEDNLSCSFYDISDKIGYIYPSSMIIEIEQDGDLRLTNSQSEDEETIIYSCVANETITIVENKVITSSVRDNLYNDFNYTYPKIGNEYTDNSYGYYADNAENVFTVNMPCTITFKYSPICKMGII